MQTFARNPEQRMFEGLKEERLAGYEGMRKFDTFLEVDEAGRRRFWYIYDGEKWLLCGPTPHHARMKKDELKMLEELSEE